MVPATPSPSAEGPAPGRQRRPLRRLAPLLPRTFRARLVLAFGAVVFIALALVMATLPRLLDSYFAQQEEKDLATRAQIVGLLLADRIFEAQGLGTANPRPVLLPTDPPRAAEEVTQLLGSADAGLVRTLAQRIAQADVEVSIAVSRDDPAAVVYRLGVPVGEEIASPGQQREPIAQSWSVALPDPWWTQFAQAAPTRLLTVRLSQPFTFRAQTINTIVGVMLAAAALALLVAAVASLLLADRLTTPIRRLTQASRSLAEGQLDARVHAPPSGSPELSELAVAFNRMAERLQASIEFVRRDRDRSRDFLADVSHELRTPIAALRTFNELLQEGSVDEATRHEFLESSRQQIERLDWLATNLLELSKLDSGLIALDLRPDDLRAVVESALQQAEATAERKDVSLSADLPTEPLRQRHDPQRLGQVLANLIGNAIKFTPAGGRVEVRLRPTEDGAELAVADTGVGIEPAELPHVFERFYRGSGANELRATGSGLGLSIVRSIVEMHGGRVTIESAPGRGTTVHVLLPRASTER
ncbi:MAG TPA: HAMP domain-containing sensor histidine kinase [Candidatus Limnocylindrales bacterium]|nr:HAMP domain-containing sensor histidine kinase [Candidatus Limnocylindrales bacterium]